MKKTVNDYELNGKKVIIRCDLNVPVKDGKIIDDNRIKESLETINYVLGKGAKVIVMSHLGRVETEEDKKKNSLNVVYERLKKLLTCNVYFSPVTRGKELEDLVNNLQVGEVLLVENTRYEDVDGNKESSNNEELAKYWASLGEVFINDAFGTLHRAHASNVGISTFLPSGVGFLVEKELKELEKLDDPKRPFVVILGGSKVKDKIGVIENLVTKADKILIGGGMAYTFLYALGYNIGKSILDEESIDFCKNVLANYKDKIVLPVDNVVTKEFSNDVPFENRQVGDFASDDMGMDIGADTIELFKKNLVDSETVFWNGPLGVYEFSNFIKGTNSILEKLSSLNNITILGGGDVVASAISLGYKDKLTHLSTGGGVTLDYMKGKKLPGIEAISNK